MKRENNTQTTPSHWDINLSLKGCLPDHSDKWAKLDVNSVPHSTFLQAMEVIAKSKKEPLFTVNHSNDMLNKDSNTTPTHQKEADTMTISREELDAKLAQNKAEVQAIASGMREDMAKWRETQNAQINQLNTMLSGLSSKIDSKFEIIDSKIDSVEKSLNAKFDGIDKSLNAKVDGISESINGKIEGLNTAITGMQSGMSTKLTKFGIAIGSVVTIIAAVAGVGISLMTSTPTNQNAQQLQPTVIYVQQPVTEKSIIQSTQEPPTQKTSNSSK